VSTHADRDEVHALRELAGMAGGLQEDLRTVRAELEAARLRIREQDTELQRLGRKLTEVTVHRDRLLSEKEQTWGQVLHRGGARTDPPFVSEGDEVDRGLDGRPT
jgi:chromosome segregation ATPase